MASEPATSFTPSGEDAITRVISVKPDESADRLPPTEFEKFYEIQRTAEEILKEGYKRVALQFPDELLHDSVPIFRQLKHRVGQGCELYVLADTSYGSCCVDEVAAQHIEADAMVHYGHACMSQTSRLPVIYVFGKKYVDVDICVLKLAESFDHDNAEVNGDHEGGHRRAILLKHDVVFTHQADEILQGLQRIFEPRNIAVLYHRIETRAMPTPSSRNGSELASTEQPPSVDESPPSEVPPSDIPLEYTTIFYVGSESLGLTNLLVTNASCNVYSFDPLTQSSRLESSRTNKILMRRYAILQKARDADVFGILVGTLGVASYLPLIKHLRNLLAQKRKKSYTISVGKLNPAKLANFLEIECFILVACPENSLIEAKDFLRPIVTPYELEIALQADPIWTGKYVLDFERLLSEAGSGTSDKLDSKDVTDNGTGEGPESDDDQPVFSLVTGTYRHAKRYGGQTSETQQQIGGGSAVVLRNQDNAVATLDSAAGQFLQQRTYQGLDMRIGEDAPSVLEQGRSGIARGYQDDQIHQEIK
ncbi:putative diphthamide synthesis protein-domain-containing protein [Crassisporium funariophilum]|nr:putative diphthamide synthesis protein-domain-containing protein [Crassisporium funariophilum]